MTPKRITSRPTWWPGEYPDSMVGRVFTYRMGAERLRLKKPPRIPVSQWAEKFRVVEQSAKPGRWRNDTAAYQVGLMDAIDHPSVETVVNCKPPQTGGTECAHNFVGSRVDMDPGEVLYVYPDDPTATLNSKDRIQPMLRKSPHMRSYMTGDDDDVSGKRIKLRHMVIYLASAQSASQLANKPCRYVVFDETDKYPTELRGESDPISLGRKRTTTYAHSRKMIELSSPTTEHGAIWSSLKTCQLVFHFWPRCPHCGQHQPMHFSGIKWDGGSDADPEEVRAYGLAWYECRHCGGAWTDDDRDDAVRAGEWRADSGGHPMFEQMDAAMGEAQGLELFAALDKVQPKKIGFHMSAWVSPWVSLSECAAAFLDGQRDKTKLKDFSNGYEAVPWKEWRQSRAEDSIMALQDEYDEGEVPEWADVLLCGADTQDNGFWYDLRAVQRGPLLRAHSIRRGFVDSLDALEEVAINTVYCKPDGTEMPLKAGVVDAMGHRTVEVYDWCRRVRLFRPLKGERKLAPLHAETKLEKMPGSGRAIPGGLILYRIDTNHFKDLLAAKLQVSVADPGAWTFARGLDPSHARHYVAEDVDEKTGYWMCPGGRANHLWDCSVYVLALAYILRLRLSRRGPAPDLPDGETTHPVVRRRARYQISR